MHIEFHLARRRLLLIAGVVVVLAAAGAAYATIPDGGGIYTACRLNGVGTIRLIDPSGSSSSLLSHCTALETQISWSQRGPKGDPGAAGANGSAGSSGVSPSVAQISAGDSHCPMGGAAITGAGGTTAYVCNGTNGADGADGQPFSGTFTSQNGQYSLTVDNNGVDIVGGGSEIKLSGGTTGLTIRSQSGIDVRGDNNVSLLAGNNVSVRGDSNVDIRGSGTVNVAASGSLTVSGSTVGINNGGPACSAAARVADMIQGVGGGDAGPIVGSILTGSTSVCIG